MGTIGILIVIIIIFLAWKHPPVALAALLQINLIRALPILNLNDLMFNYSNENSLTFGLLLPLVSFFLLSLKLALQRKKTIYFFDETNYFIVALTLLLVVGCFYSPNLLEALEYTARFVLLGVSFYFIGKVYLLNTADYHKAIKQFFLATYWLGVFLGTIAVILVLYSQQEVSQLTIPGVHPNPFALLIGITVVISFVIFYTHGKVFAIKKKWFLYLNYTIFIYISILLFSTNSRGVLLSTIISILSYLMLNKVKINRKKLIVLSLIVFGVLFYVSFLIDTEVLFHRLLNSANDQSIGDRFVAYQDSINILFSNLFGAGTGGFKYHSILDYPHNLLLENIALFGVLGVLIDIYLIFLIFFLLYKSYISRRTNPYFVFLFSVFIYFFIETMFSFTLWMHKGLYLSLALVSVNLYKAKSRIEK